MNKNKPGILVRIVNILGILCMALGVLGAFISIGNGDVSTAITGGIAFLMIGLLLFSVGKWNKIKKESLNGSENPEKIERKIMKQQQKLQELDVKIQEKKTELELLDDETTLLDFGFYEPKYNCTNSEEYK